ncbi:zinc knuckle family protein, partial [Puccinia sorghi]
AFGMAGRPVSPLLAPSAPTTKTNAILLAFRSGQHNQLSDAKHPRRAQLNLCFRCGQSGHVY